MEHSTEWLDGWFAQKEGVGSFNNPFSHRSRPISHNRWGLGWIARSVASGNGFGVEDNAIEKSYVELCSR